LRSSQSNIKADSLFLPHIEGLRAFAVMAVLAFHFKLLPCFAGGFVGVDVFFVISGYLITRNVFPEIQKEVFSFQTFYGRRISRIVPALFFTIALTLTAGIIFSSPADLKHTSESAIASIFSVSNFYFWSQSGYFEASAIQKPLLHTWALAVEFQYYLIWPVLIALLVRLLRNTRNSVVVLTAVGVLSFIVAEIAIVKDPSGAFYLMPFRIGEFTVGAVCALVPFRLTAAGWIRNTLALSGFILFFYAVFTYSDATRFPGLMALVPCLGAVLLIRFGSESKIAQPLLSNRLFVGLGRISYSLYLVHWPLFVFFRQWHGCDPGVVGRISIIVVSVITAVAMYRFVENPFRISSQSEKKNTRSFADFMKLSAGGMVCLFTVSMMISAGNGWAWRFPDELTRFSKEAEAEKKARFKLVHEMSSVNQSIVVGTPKKGFTVIIIGDSHAPDALNALAAHYPEYHYEVHGLAGCPPLVREDYKLLTAKHPDREGCIKRNERLLYQGQLSHADLIIINTVFSWYRPENLKRTIMCIRNQTNIPIIVLGNYMFFKEDVPEMVIRDGNMEMNAHYETNMDWHSFAFDDELKTLASTLQVIFISKRELLCRGDSVSDCPLMFGGKLFTYDRHHFSVPAAQYMGLMLKEKHNEYFLKTGSCAMEENSGSCH